MQIFAIGRPCAKNASGLSYKMPFSKLLYRQKNLILLQASLYVSGMSAHFPTCPSSPEEGLKARLHYRLNGPWLKLLHVPFAPRRFSRGMSPPLKSKFCRKRLSKHNCRQNDYLAQSPKRQGFSVPTCCSRCFCQGATRTFAHAIRCTNVGCVAVRAFCDYRLSRGHS